MVEKILQQRGTEKYSLFPIEHPDLWQYYKDAQASNWTAEELDFEEDLDDWRDKLNEDEKYFIKNILGFFNQADGIVNENLAENFYREVQYNEAKFFYAFQIAMENVHSETYSLLLDTFIKDNEEKQKLFLAIENIPCVAKKAEWALKWISSESFVERLIAFAAVEGIFFSGSFCSIFWLKDRNLMPGLTKSNELISRDEGLHCNFACYLYNNHIKNKLSEDKLKEIILQAVEIEKEFVTDSLPVSLIGMNATLMTQYLECVTDRLLVAIGGKKHFNSENPFSWMDMINLDVKTNFFDKRVAAYRKANVGMTSEESTFALDATF